MNENLVSMEEKNIIDKCECYTYNGKKLAHPFAIGIFVLIYLVVFVLIYIVIFANLNVIKNVKLQSLSLYILPIMIILFGYIIKKMQFDTMKMLTQYFKDENGIYYKIKFTKVSAKILHVRRYYSLIPLVGEVKTFIDAYKKLIEKEKILDEAFSEAQNKALGYYYVKRYKDGISDWNWIHGGEAKVIPLGNLIKKSNRIYKFNDNGKIKTIKIPAYYSVQ